jgi:hypothetical protein
MRATQRIKKAIQSRLDAALDCFTVRAVQSGEQRDGFYQ